MVEIFKLQSLPSVQKCRKVLRILEAAEKAYRAGQPDEFLDIFYLKSLLNAVTNELPYKEAEYIEKWRKEPSSIDKIRIINFTRHALYKKTGSEPAEWDLILPNTPVHDIAAFRRFYFKNLYVFAEDIRTPFNIGSVFRTAESFGVEKIFLSENCISPEHHKARRTAMGCVDYMHWERVSISNLPKDIPLIALETGGEDIAKFVFPKTGIAMIGSEELGLSPTAIKKADAVVSIPMYGIKASINVSVAFGILMQKWTEHLDSYPNTDAG